MVGPVTQALACVSGVWACVVFLVQGIGILQLFRNYSHPPRRAAVESSAPSSPLPLVTVIRPIKGLEPGLFDCLASTCRQSYPRARLRVCLCVESRADPAFPVLERVVAAFPDVRVRILVEDEDEQAAALGPNPKVRNVSRAYREAGVGDDVDDPENVVVWIVDCNVWVAPGTAGRMVDKLYGWAADGTRVRPYKFVHQLPLVVDVAADRAGAASFGSALDELFMATSHAKFYAAINTVGIAPCIVGKSNMFRRAHLDRATDPAQNPLLTPADAARGRGVDFFSSYICEDHLIGDLLWRTRLDSPAQDAASAGTALRNHGLVADLAVQPMAGVSAAAYAARRVRWLRVRKWTVLLATLVEPGVESLVCAAHVAFAWGVWGGRTLPQMAAAWAAVVLAWMAADYATSRHLLALRSVAVDADTPVFVRDPPRKPRARWLRAWAARELLALPIWTDAVLLGATVAWRGQRFRVRMDMRVSEIGAGDAGDAKARRD